MKRERTILVTGLVKALGVLVASSAGAAELKQVNDWGASGVRGDVSMHIYVPDQVGAAAESSACAYSVRKTAPSKNLLALVLLGLTLTRLRRRAKGSVTGSMP